MTETPHQNHRRPSPLNPDKESKEFVKLPKWLWELVSRLLLVFILGACLTLVLSLSWLFVLTNVHFKTAKELETVENIIKKIQGEGVDPKK